MNHWWLKSWHPNKNTWGIQYSISKKQPLDEHHDYIEKTVSKRIFGRMNIQIYAWHVATKKKWCAVVHAVTQSKKEGGTSVLLRAHFGLCEGSQTAIKPMSCSMTSVVPNMCAKEPIQSDFGHLSRIYEAERNSFQFPVLEGSRLPTSWGLGWGAFNLPRNETESCCNSHHFVNPNVWSLNFLTRNAISPSQAGAKW